MVQAGEYKVHEITKVLLSICLLELSTALSSSLSAHFSCFRLESAHHNIIYKNILLALFYIPAKHTTLQLKITLLHLEH